jgi:hypothetical protein
MKRICLAISLFIIVLGCATPKTSFVTPCGNISYSGKLTKMNYHQISKQHFFAKNDSIWISVTKNQQDKYPFYNSTLSDTEFTQEFFEWKKEFYQQQGVEMKLLKSKPQLVVWTATANYINSIFLYG